jgi:serine/threonine-protein kinase
LYSLGITFYEMVTGQKPFQGESDYSIMAAHLQQTPAAPIEVVPGVPSELSEIILTAIAKDPASRFQNADAFRAALKSLNMPAAVPVATHTLVASAGGPPPMPAPMPPPMFAPEPPAMAAPRIQPPPPMPPSPPPMAAPPPPFAYQAPPPVYQAPPAYQTPPPPPPYAVPQPKSSSRRGLYMTLGSVVTLLVLAAAIFYVPKLRHTNAQDPVSASVTPAVNPTPLTQTPEAPPTPTPAPVEPTPAPSPAPATQTPIQVATQTKPAPSPRPTAVTPVQAPAQTPTQYTPPNPAPVQAQVVPPPQPVPVPVQPRQVPPAAPDPQRAQLNQLRQEYNQLSIRATTAKEGLSGLQQQMQSQGLNLRADMREARTSMDYQLKEAMDSIRSGDTENAEKDLTMARFALEKIEKFLGR